MKKAFLFLISCIAFVFALFSVTDKNSYVAADTNEFKVTITIPKEYKDCGSYNIFVVGPDGESTPVEKDASNIYSFPEGTDIIIEAVPNPFYAFTKFEPDWPSEFRQGEPEKRYVKVVIDKNFSIFFESVIYDIDKTIINSTNDTIHVSTDKFKINDNIYISLDYSPFRDIKEFWINGQLISDEDYRGKIEFINNVATIKITEDWLSAYGNVLDVQVTTKFNDAFAIGFLCAVILLPLFFLLLIYLMRTGSQQRKAAKEAILTQQSNLQMRDAGAFIEGVKEGTISGKITEKQIKDELDKHK